MKKSHNKTILLFVSFLVLLIACKKNDDNSSPAPEITKGVFIVNEGSFGSGNSSISYLEFSSKVVTNNLFEMVNSYPLGDVAQSMMIHGTKGYLIVNNSQKVEVVNISNFQSIQTIGGLQGPRYMVANANKGYISDWFSNEVAVVDLNLNTITKHIPAGNGPEQMKIAGNVLFVCNAGGFGIDSTISIVNLLTEQNVGKISTGINPNSIQTDANGKLWVLCGGSTGPDFIGGTPDDIGGALCKINPITFTVEQQFSMPAAMHPIKLQINNAGTELFFLSGDDGYTGKIIKHSVNSTSLNNNPVINKNFYGLGIDPSSNEIYGAYVPGFTQNGYVFRYNSGYQLIDSMEVGIAPNFFNFN